MFSKINTEKVEINITRSLEDHNNSVNCILILQDGRLASGLEDATINIYNIKNDYHCDSTLKDHNLSVLCIEQDEVGRLISCDRQNILFWYKKGITFICEKVLRLCEPNDNNQISFFISLLKNRIACCIGTVIKIYHTGFPYNNIACLRKHKKQILSLVKLKKKNLLISISEEGTALVWNSSLYKLETTIKIISCVDKYSVIEMKNNFIIFGKSQIIDLNLTTLTSTPVGNVLFNGITATLLISENMAVLGTCDGRILLFDGESIKECKIKLHHQKINKLIKLNEEEFISCSSDKSIKVWNMQFISSQNSLW